MVSQTYPINNTCPICGQTADVLHEMKFQERTGLPETIQLCVCDCCDFAYTTPRNADGYAHYYANNCNDMFGFYEITNHEMNRYRSQALAISHILGKTEQLKVLDIGCGKALLLRTLKELYPQHIYSGIDPSVEDEGDADGVLLYKNATSITGEFDLIILSHVLEHIIDFNTFSFIFLKLSKTGFIYIEVPDGSCYQKLARREYLGFIDRLHVNHFTPFSLNLLLTKWGLNVSKTGHQLIDFNDGHPIEACYAIASKLEVYQCDDTKQGSIRENLLKYISIESDRSDRWKKQLQPFGEIVVYGFGDNFFRALLPGGPLHDVTIAAVVDRRWKELSQGIYSRQYKFIELSEAVEKYPSHPFIVAISWGADTVVEQLEKAGAKNIILL